MINCFFGAEIVRSEHSAQMFFSRKEITRMLGISEKQIEGRLNRLKYPHIRGLRWGRLHHFKYGLDAVLALLFSASTHSERQTKRFRELSNFICTHIGNICFDGFSSMRGYHLPLQYRRAIMAHVCNVDTYTDIVTARFNNSLPDKGTLLKKSQCTLDLLIQPESYITRKEITHIKAIDLAVYLLAAHHQKVTNDDKF